MSKTNNKPEETESNSKDKLWNKTGGWIGSVLAGTFFMTCFFLATHPTPGYFWLGLHVLMGNEEVLKHALPTFSTEDIEKAKRARYAELKKNARYRDVGEKHFIDTSTGIVWVKMVVPLNEAVEFVKRNDQYRLPTLSELSSLMDCGSAILRYPLNLIDYREFKLTSFEHNGRCMREVNGSAIPSVLSGFEGHLISSDTYKNFPLRVWGVSSRDGGAALYERQQHGLHTVLIRK